MGTRTLDMDRLYLSYGKHSSPPTIGDSNRVGLCVMEAAAYVAGEPHSDHPDCVSLVIAAFLRYWNDALLSGERQSLKQHIEPIIGTRGVHPPDVQKALETVRAWMLVDWAVRTALPDMAENGASPAAMVFLRDLPPINQKSWPDIARRLSCKKRTPHVFTRAMQQNGVGAASLASSSFVHGDPIADVLRFFPVSTFGGRVDLSVTGHQLVRNMIAVGQ